MLPTRAPPRRVTPCTAPAHPLLRRAAVAMADTAGVTSWVADALHGVLGYSDASLAAFFVSLATSTPSPSALWASLRAADVPDTPAAHTFADELYARVPHATAAKRPAPGGGAKESANAALLRKSANYRLISTPTPTPTPPVTVAPAPTPAP
ncbi:hypothetical protein EON68_04650, partial [archaeon]